MCRRVFAGPTNYRPIGDIDEDKLRFPRFGPGNDKHRFRDQELGYLYRHPFLLNLVRRPHLVSLGVFRVPMVFQTVTHRGTEKQEYPGLTEVRRDRETTFRKHLQKGRPSGKGRQDRRFAYRTAERGRDLY